MIKSEQRNITPLVSLLLSANVQFVLGFLLSIFLVGCIIWDLNFSTWITRTTRFNSLSIVSGIYLFSFFSLQRFLNFLGYLSLRSVIPTFALWTMVFLGLLFLFRLPYSVYFLIGSLSVMPIFFWGMSFIRNHYGRLRVAYVEKGLSVTLPEVATIHWEALKAPVTMDTLRADLVVADLRADLGKAWESFLADCALQQIPVYHSVRLIEMVSGRVRIDHLYENELGSLLPSKSYLLIKRLIDTLAIVCSAPVVLPVMLVTALLIKWESPGGVFFLQERIGQGGKPFTVYKFRSMCATSEADGAQFAAKNDMRVTRVGRFIRKTRIDEFPQFYNVLRGEMSLIGPRPEQEQFVQSFKEDIPFYSYRHMVKPGISGWAQVMQGYAADAEDTKIKLEYDFYYIKNFSFALDILVTLKTIQTMLTGFGAR